MLAYLSADFIPLPLVFSIVGHDDKKRLSNMVAGLEALSLVRVVKLDVYTVGLLVHR